MWTLLLAKGCAAGFGKIWAAVFAPYWLSCADSAPLKSRFKRKELFNFQYCGSALVSVSMQVRIQYFWSMRSCRPRVLMTKNGKKITDWKFTFIFFIQGQGRPRRGLHFSKENIQRHFFPPGSGSQPAKMNWGSGSTKLLVSVIYFNVPDHVPGFRIWMLLLLR